MDEGYFGGRRNAGKNNQNLSEAVLSKSVAVAAIQRDGDVKASISPNAGAQALGVFLHNNVDPNGTRLMTDRSNRYQKIAKPYNRQSVDHGRGEYVRGDVHVNSVESFWAHVKRSIKGTHKSISKKYLQSYLDGFVWHRNNRSNDRERFASLLGILIHA